MLNYLMNKELAGYLTKLYTGVTITESVIEEISKKTFSTDMSKFDLITNLDEIVIKHNKNDGVGLVITNVEILPTTPGNFKVNFVAEEKTTQNAQTAYKTLFNDLIGNNKNNKQFKLINNSNSIIGELIPNSLITNNSFNELEKYEFIISLIMRIELHAAQLKENYKEKSVLTEYIHALEYLLKDL